MDQIIEQLTRKSAELQAAIPLVWRAPVRLPKKPAQARVQAQWPVWDPQKATSLRPNQRFWLYANLVFPRRKSGVALTGTEALVQIRHGIPFTLWVDGAEMFKETRAWSASGPIADPLPVPIEPGKGTSLAMCLRPTVLVGGFRPQPNVIVQSRRCLELGVELAAAAAQLRLARALASTAAEKRLVTQAAAALNQDALAGNQWDAALESIERMEARLAPLSTKARQKVVHLVGHTHIDMQWLWTWEDTVHCARRDFKAVIDLMDEVPGLTFANSQIPTYEVVQQMDPRIFAKVKRRIAEGRWVNTAATWVEGDFNMAHGESVARQFLYAADWGRANLGTAAKFLWSPDTFGHPGNMPQLARLAEMECYYNGRCNPGRGGDWPFRLWEGIDGTTIPAFTVGYMDTLDPASTVGKVLFFHRFGYDDSLHLWGIGNHGGAVSRLQLEILARYRDKPIMPTFQFSTPARALTALQKAKTAPPTHKGESRTVFEGCLTTHAGVKEYNRKCEGALLTAESLAALAGLDRNKVLRKAWLDTLFNQFHDILAGCSVAEAYVDAHAKGERSLRAAEKVTQSALRVLTKGRKAGNGLALINPLGFPCTEPVRASLPQTTRCLLDADGASIPVQKMDDQFVFLARAVPAFSRKDLTIVTGRTRKEPTESVAVHEEEQYYRVETAHAIVRVSKDSGAFCSYLDKQLDRDLLGDTALKRGSNRRADLGMNVFQLIDASPTYWSAWFMKDVLREESLVRNARVSLVETGPVFARLRVRHSFRASRLVEDIVFYRDSPRVDFRVTVTWRELGSDEAGIPHLKVAFNASLRAARARFEGPFSVAERPADGQEQPTQNWVDLCGDEFGYALLNDSRYGCDVLGGRARLTLLRTSYAPDPRSDSGRHTFRFAFLPHGPEMSAAELIRAGMAFSRPPLCRRAPAADGTRDAYLVAEGGDSVVCTALRRAEHSDRLLIRFFEAEGKRARLRFSLGRGLAGAQPVNLLEKPLGGKSVVSGGKATLHFRPYEVKSLLVDLRQ